MNRLLVVSAVALALVSVLDDTASAQRRRRPNRFRDRPAVSPYLNLFRGDTDPGFNYFRLVRPELEFRAFNERQLQTNFRIEGQLGAIEGALGQPAPATTLGGTGHPTFFMNHFGAYKFERGGRRSGRNRSEGLRTRSTSRVRSRVPNVRGSIRR
jgi:hypothetical protein